MSLRIWLPLTGNLNNNGLEDITISSTNATVDNNGKIGSCYSFNGNSSYLLGTHNFINNNTDDWSFCCWMKVNNAHTGCLFSCRNNVNYNGITIFYYGSQWIIDDGNRWQFTPTITIAANTWYHVCVIRKKGVGKFLYINGILDSSTESVGTQTNVSPTYFSIGACQQGSPTSISGNWYNGYLNDIRFYDHVLSIKEIKDIAKGLVVHYLLNGGNFIPNLLRSNPLQHYATSYCGYQFKLSENMVAGTKYTIQLWDINISHSAKTSSQLNITIYWGGGMNREIGFDIPTGHADYLVGTFTAQSNSKPDDANNLWLNVYNSTPSVSGTMNMSIGKWKLEKGEAATPWVPNIEDPNYSVFEFDSTKEIDVSGYKNNAEIIGTLNRTNDCPRNILSAKFPTNTDYIKLLNLSTSGFADSYTFSWWGKYSNYTGHMMWGFANGNRLNLYMSNSGKNFYWNTGDSLNNPFGSVKPSEYANEWHHFVVTGDGNVNKLYIDGEFQANATTYRGLTGAHIILNGWDTSVNYKFNGYLSDFRIYATCLSEDDIRELYNKPIILTNNGDMISQGEYVEDNSTLQFYKNGIIKSPKIVEDSLVDVFTQTNPVQQYTPTDINNWTTTYGKWMITDDDLPGDKFRIYLTVQYNGFDTSSTSGTFNMRFQGANFTTPTTSEWSGSNAVTAALNAQYSLKELVLSGVSGTYTYECTFTLTEDFYNNYYGSNIGLRSDYSNGTAWIKVSDIKIIPEKYLLESNVKTKVGQNYISTKEIIEN